MKVSELAKRSGVSIPTIKYYLREGLLPTGTPTATNQSSYDDEHLRRLRLVRALIDIGGLQIAQVRATLGVVDDDSAPLHEAFGAVMTGLAELPSSPPPDDVAVAEVDVDTWLESRSWTVAPGAPARRRLAEALTTLQRFGIAMGAADLDQHADFAEQVARLEVDFALAAPDRVAAVETMLVGTVVLERAHAEVRRLALEAVSAAARPDPSPPPTSSRSPSPPPG
ncbi:MerR family transcriptional regulator [Aeromicrobium sp. CF4.19]|uniref:MerR family transcriptional regulator n=1 Tax=Aeromicrobium sp. CF4.19 TaxID=3373082 RepID=UPI003EE63C6F